MSCEQPPKGALHAPAASRNREPIAKVLANVLPQHGLVLEVASGSGEHSVFFAQRFAHLQWQPSDADPTAVTSIDAWRQQAKVANLGAPLLLDVHQRPWAIDHADVIININMVHISPWSACEALLQESARLLPASGMLFMYGPYKIDGEHTAPSNAQFDMSLRQRNAQWGVRDLHDVQALAEKCGLACIETLPMPANNFSVIYRRM